MDYAIFLSKDALMPHARIHGDDMKLSDLDMILGGKGSDIYHAHNPSVSAISCDSRIVKPGSVFFALSGRHHDGAKYVNNAIDAGAIAIVTDQHTEFPSLGVPILRSDNPRLALAKAAARFFENQPGNIVAVTGTAGKTSVASFAQQIWVRLGFDAAMIGTTGVISPSRNDYGSLTTPDPVALHALLSELCHEGISHCAMEASSHGLDQYRLDGVNLSAAAFTNLGRDHMDYHPNIDHYFNAKMALFERILEPGKPAVIFSDDEWSDQAIEHAKQAGHDVLTVGAKGDFLTVKRVEQMRFSQRAEIHANGDIFEVELPLAGDFQLANALVAAGLVIATGADMRDALSSLSHLRGAKGRLDLVGNAPCGAPIYVDYAHKPDALEHVLKAVRPFTSGRIILVFGCGGDRDQGKRGIMGEIANRLSDISIVTDDNPRTEAASSIRAQILEQAPNAIEIADRSQAIANAVDMLGEGDSLIIAGKGHEHGQIIGDQILPFSDHEAAKLALEGLSEGVKGTSKA